MSSKTKRIVNQSKDEDDFNDAITKELVRHQAGDFVGDEETLKQSVQDRYFEVTPNFADNLFRLHGIKPPDRKTWKPNHYTGRGMLSVPDIILESLRQGQLTLMERKKVRKNPIRPHVAMLMDVSYSMFANNVVKAGILLSATFIEFFGRGFAKDFSLATIGAGAPDVLMNCDYNDAKRFVIGARYGEMGTDFIRPINALEEWGFFDNRDTKYVFVITDGRPENSGELRQSKYAVSSLNEARTNSSIEKLVWYIQNRWDKDQKIEYFWINLADDTRYETILHFLSMFVSYVVPEDEALAMNFTKSQWESAKRNKSSWHSGVYGKYGKFLWEMFKMGNFFYATLDQLENGTAFHNMMDYFVQKYKSHIALQ